MKSTIMNAAAVLAGMEESVPMESMLTCVFASLVSLGRTVKWTLMTVIKHPVKMKVRK